MTPEERIRRLRDGSRWQMESLNERPDAGRRPAERPARPWSVAIVGVATVAVAAVVIVAAVNLRPTGETPPISDTDSPAPSVTSTPTRPLPSNTPTSPPTDVPSNTPTAPPTTPPPTNAAGGEKATLTTSGYGDIKLGYPVPADTTLVTWDPTYCPDLTGGDVPKGGRWIASGAHPSDSDPDGGVTVRTEGDFTKKTGKVDTIFITDPSITTKSGAHVGMTRSELTNLIPGLVHKAYHGNSTDAYYISQGGQYVVFEVSNDDGLVAYDQNKPFPKDTVIWMFTAPGYQVDDKPMTYPGLFWGTHTPQSCA